MKAFTDIEQSKKLAKILPIESADMHYVRKVCDFRGRPVDGKWSEPKYGNTNSDYANYIVQNFTQYDKLPCWSLAALLELIQDDIKIEKTLFDQSDLFTYSILSDTFDYRTYEHEELIDACYEMIVKLKEKGLI